MSWLQTEQDLIDLDRRNPGTWTPPADREAARATASLTLSDYSTRWLSQRAVSRRTRESYTYLLTTHVLPALGGQVLTDITSEEVRQWFAGMDPAKPTARARAYETLASLLNTAVTDGLIDRSPARVTGGAAVKRSRQVVLLEPDQLAQLGAAMPEHLRLTVLLAGWCGLRRGEAFALTRGDVGKDCATVSVTKAVTYREREYLCGPTKTESSIRTVTVPPHLRPLLGEHLTRHTGKGRASLLFPDPVTGSFMAEGRYRGHFAAAREAIDQPGLRFHDLRHAAGVLVAQSGATIRETMDYLGHSTSAAAMRYQHTAAGRADALAARLSAMATGTPAPHLSIVRQA
ncbi:MAG: tyrosine-type recombinase/integrase [Candidatus Nanopelagicales bacterium]